MNLLGLACWLTGKHRWRRLRSGERFTDRDGTPYTDAELLRMRICRRCEATKFVRQRKAKS